MFPHSLLQSVYPIVRRVVSGQVSLSIKLDWIVRGDCSDFMVNYVIMLHTCVSPNHTMVVLCPAHVCQGGVWGQD